MINNSIWITKKHQLVCLIDSIVTKQLGTPSTNKVGLSVAQMVKNLPVVQETWVQSLVWEDPLERGMATHSTVLAWRIPWTEEPGGLYSPWGLKESDMTEWWTLFILFASMWNEHSCMMVWTFFGIAFLWDWNENCPFPFSSPVAAAEFSKFADLLSAAFQQYHLLGYEIVQLEFHYFVRSDAS